MTKQRKHMKAAHMGGGNQSNVERGHHIGKRQLIRFVRKTPTSGIRPETLFQWVLAGVVTIFTLSKCLGL